MDKKPPVLTMKPEYAFKSYIPDPNRPTWNWVLVDDVARLDEWAERLNIKNFKPLSDVLGKNLTGVESSMEAFHIRSETLHQFSGALTEDVTLYSIVPVEMLEAAIVDQAYNQEVFARASIPTSLTFLAKYAAYISERFFVCPRDHKGDGWSRFNVVPQEDQKQQIIADAFNFAVSSGAMSNLLPAVYTPRKGFSLGRRHGLATTVDDTWLREQLEASGKPENGHFFGHWTLPNNGIFDEETMRKLRESPLTKESSFSRDLFTEAQLKHMQDVIPEVFLADGTISINVLSKYYTGKAVMVPSDSQRRALRRFRGLDDIVPDSMRKVIDAIPGSSMLVMGQPHVYDRDPSLVVDDINKALVSALAGISPPKPPIMPSAVLDTINKYLDEVKDKPVTPFDDVQIEGGEDGLAFTVTFTTTDPVMKDLLLKAGAVAVPEPKDPE